MEAEVTYGAISLIPVVVIITMALITKKTFEPLLVAVLVAVIIDTGPDFLEGFVITLLTQMADPVIGWVILVCGMMGALLFILEKSNAAGAFADLLAKFAKTRKRAMFATMFFGICLFIDDYLNVLTVGSTMKKVTDKHNVSRTMLAYSVHSTAAPICILAPISTWAIFFMSLMAGEGIEGPDGTIFSAYLNVIPYLFYGWICVFIVLPLVILGVIPLVGPMKSQFEHAQKTGELFPPGIPPQGNVSDSELEKTKAGMWDFILPLVVLVGATLYFERDVLMGVVVALAFTAVLYIVRKIAKLNELVEQFWSGFATMLQVFGLLVLAFSFADATANLGLIDYVLEVVAPIMSGDLLPAVVFVVTAAMAFAMANFWGLAAIVLPIAVPLANMMGVDVYLVCAAVFCGAAFGSHACFYADSCILTGQATNLRPYDHAIT